MLRRLVLLYLLLLGPGVVQAESRAAFVVGNSNYEHAPSLANPVRDARLVADTLSGLGFDVTRHDNLTRDGFADALSDFVRRSRDADVTFFYFAGHGMQYEGENYLVGTNAELRSELDIEGEAIPLERVVSLLERNSKAALVFIDACRDNPLATNFYRRNFSETRALQTRGLARMSTPADGAMLVFAAAPGQVAYDGKGLNSPFASSLARHLPTANTEILSLTKRIIRDVREETGGKQSPIVTNDLTREIFLREAALRPGTVVDSGTVDAEQMVFEAAEELDTLHAWAMYFEKYPKGRLASLALQREHDVLLREAGYLSTGWRYEPAPTMVSDSMAGRFNERLGLDRNDAVAIQALLRRRGHYDGPLDGVLGDGSREAIRSFQRAEGLVETGIVTRATVGRLGLTSRKLTDRPVFSSHRRASLKLEPARQLGFDARLIAFLEESGGWSSNIYGFDSDRLYLSTSDFNAAIKYHPNKIDEDSSIYPVSIGSFDENRFVYELVRYDGSLWINSDEWLHGPSIGLSQRPDGREPAGGWIFEKEPDNNFRNWERHNPDDFQGHQDYARIWVPKSAATAGMPDLPRGPTWDDTMFFNRQIILELE